MLLLNQRDVEYPSGSTMETNTNTTTISKLWLMFNIGSQGWPWIEIRIQASANQDHLKDKKQTNKQCTKKWENQINSIVSYICACATISKALYKQTIRLSSCLISLLTKEQAQHFCLKGKSSDWENDMEIYQNTSVTLESSIFARKSMVVRCKGGLEPRCLDRRWRCPRPLLPIDLDTSLPTSHQHTWVATSSESVKLSRTTFNQPKDLLKGPTFPVQLLCLII